MTYDRSGPQLGKLADVFGDATRRAVFRYLREQDEPITASEVGEQFGLHRTVARAHLEKLGEIGLVMTGTRRRSGGGRPAKTYTPSGERLEIMLPPRRFERLARLVLQALERTVDTETARATALACGRSYGEQVAQSIAGPGVMPPVHLTPAAVRDWLEESGYQVQLTNGRPDRLAIEVHNCVYRELAVEYPKLVCPFDCGLLQGMLGARPEQHRQPLAISAGDDHCRHEFAF
jgi:predicted ArsR family transcriptional regulator